MDADYRKLFFACDLETYQKIQRAMVGLDARETETTFDRAVYFYVVIHSDDLEEFNRRLEEGDPAT